MLKKTALTICISSLLVSASSSFASDITSKIPLTALAIIEDIKDNQSAFKSTFLNTEKTAYPFFRSKSENNNNVKNWYIGENIPIKALKGYRFILKDVIPWNGNYYDIYDITVDDTTTLEDLGFDPKPRDGFTKLLYVIDPSSTNFGLRSFNGEPDNETPFGYPYPADFGVKKKDVDWNIRPQDDLYNHVNSQWLKKTKIPETMNKISYVEMSRVKVKNDISSLVEAIRNYSNLPNNSEERKIVDLYDSYLNTDLLDSISLSALDDELKKIDNIRNKDDLVRYFAYAESIGIKSPFDIQVIPDPNDTNKYNTIILQSGLGLPSENIYLSPKYKKLMHGYLNHIGKAFEMANMVAPYDQASLVVSLETDIATFFMPAEKMSDRKNMINPRTIEELNKESSNINWTLYFSSLNAPKLSHTLLGMPDFTTNIDWLSKPELMSSWRAYFKWQLINSYSPYIDKNFESHKFNFYSKGLYGIAKMDSREARAFSLLDNTLGQAVGRLYTSAYFSNEKKIAIQKIVGNVKSAYKKRIMASTWMSEKSKSLSIAKLNNIDVKIGYPDNGVTYDSLSIKPDDLVGNIIRTNKFKLKKEISKLDKNQVDRNEWVLYPQTVNAQSRDTMVDITFPAALLQPPIYSQYASAAANYSSIGMTIGHELSHQFDDDYIPFDQHGNYTNWMPKAEMARYHKRTSALIEQYNDKYLVNGRRTLVENIGDLTGVNIAFDAFKALPNEQKQDNKDAFSPYQQFFLNYTKFLRTKYSPMSNINSGKHAPAEYRVNGVMQNALGFYDSDAFSLQPGDKLYLPESKRADIW